MPAEVTVEGSELSGLDALETAVAYREPRLRRAWAATWPPLVAIGLVVLVWQIVVWAKWKPDYALASPSAVASDLWHSLGTKDLWHALGTTMRRAITGYSLAVLIGLVVGMLVARSKVLRAAVGSLITGLQTMPSIAWFPLAILLFQISEKAILFVVVLGAAPSIANGVIAGVDYVPPALLRAGRNIGASGLRLYTHVVAPASLPWIVAGLKQGWAFAWRSLMAGELLVIIAERPSLGVRMQSAREFADSPGLLSSMVLILIIGVLVDRVFGAADRIIRQRWGVVEAG